MGFSPTDALMTLHKATSTLTRMGRSLTPHPKQSTNAIYFSSGMGHIRILPSVFPEFSAVKKATGTRYHDCNAVLGWGLKPTADRARRYAAKSNIPYLAVEDGFLRSLGLGVAGFQPHSLVVDRTGIYYDATRPSDLESLILDADKDPQLLARAKNAMALLRQQRLSKYNHAPDQPVFPDDAKKRVLVVDQTFGDASISYGAASAETFTAMLSVRACENPTLPGVSRGRQSLGAV